MEDGILDLDGTIWSIVAFPTQEFFQSVFHSFLSLPTIVTWKHSLEEDCYLINYFVLCFDLAHVATMAMDHAGDCLCVTSSAVTRNGKGQGHCARDTIAASNTAVLFQICCQSIDSKINTSPPHHTLGNVALQLMALSLQDHLITSTLPIP